MINFNTILTMISSHCGKVNGKDIPAFSLRSPVAKCYVDRLLHPYDRVLTTLLAGNQIRLNLRLFTFECRPVITDRSYSGFFLCISHLSGHSRLLFFI